jgi:hypothetical protein
VLTRVPAGARAARPPDRRLRPSPARGRPDQGPGRRRDARLGVGAAGPRSGGARPGLVDDTLGVVLKYEEDVRRVRGDAPAISRSSPPARSRGETRVTSTGPRPSRGLPPWVLPLVGAGPGQGARPSTAGVSWAGPSALPASSGWPGWPPTWARPSTSAGRSGRDRARRPGAGPGGGRGGLRPAARRDRDLQRSSSSGSGEARRSAPANQDGPLPVQPPREEAGRGPDGRRRRRGQTQEIRRIDARGRAPLGRRRRGRRRGAARLDGLAVSELAYGQGEVDRHQQFDRMSARRAARRRAADRPAPAQPRARRTRRSELHHHGRTVAPG